MAVTSIWPITGNPDGVIEYAINPEKTSEESREETAALHAIDNVVEYTADDLKTEKRRRQVLENESPDTPVDGQSDPVTPDEPGPATPPESTIEEEIVSPSENLQRKTRMGKAPTGDGPRGRLKTAKDGADAIQKEQQIKGPARRKNNSIKTLQKPERTIKQTTRTAEQSAKTLECSVKGTQKAVKTAEQSSKVAIKTAQETAKAAQKSAQAAAKAAEKAVQIARATAKAAAKAAAAAAKAGTEANAE